MPEETPPSRKYWFRLNFETVAALAAVVTSASAVFIAWQETRIMRDMQHAEVIPILYAFTDFDVQALEGPNLQLGVTNAGIGPAKIQSLSVIYRGETLQNWRSYETAVLPEAMRNRFSVERVDRLERRVLQAGEARKVLVIEWPDEPNAKQSISRLVDSVVNGDREAPYVQVCYCSVFDRCWRTRIEAEPERVERCPEPTDFTETFFRKENS